MRHVPDFSSYSYTQCDRCGEMLFKRAEQVWVSAVGNPDCADATGVLPVDHKLAELLDNASKAQAAYEAARRRLREAEEVVRNARHEERLASDAMSEATVAREKAKVWLAAHLFVEPADE